MKHALREGAVDTREGTGEISIREKKGKYKECDKQVKGKGTDEGKGEPEGKG